MVLNQYLLALSLTIFLLLLICGTASLITLMVFENVSGSINTIPGKLILFFCFSYSLSLIAVYVV